MKNDFFDKLGTSIIHILALPLYCYFFTIHTYEEVMKNNDNFRDKLFLKKMNLLDNKHVSDFLEWNKRYLYERENGPQDDIESKFERLQIENEELLSFISENELDDQLVEFKKIPKLIK
jgi:hypothetical protein